MAVRRYVPSVPRVCEQCGTPFLAMMHQVRLGYARYCSRRCFYPNKPRRPVADRFWARVERRGPSECWLWTGHRNNMGYGLIGVGNLIDKTKTMALVHRVSWEIHNGPISDGLWVLHRCDTPLCVNPSHLFLGTHLDNMRDQAAKGRRPSGESAHGAKLTDDDVRAIRVALSVGNEKQSVVGQRFGVSQSVISQISTGKKWSHVK